MQLQDSFYRREDVVEIARDLLGKVLCTRMDAILTSGMIIETEAYAGIVDKASHAYNGRRTPRTEIMFREGGIAYVYLCYGIHSLFNIVTATKDMPHAVLIRGIKPLEGLEHMSCRKNKPISLKAGIGPGNVSSLLGIHFSHSGTSLTPGEGEPGLIWIEDRGFMVKDEDIITGPRIGVDYAGMDALLPYRFRIEMA